MENLPSTLLFFVLSLAILISVHEFGHFWVARKLGVKVLTFSIGFGKPLWKRTGKIDNTEYVVAAIPLGGYVKMLDEREAPVAEHELHRAFNRQKLSVRSAIVFAGPLMNFIFAILAYWLIFSVGETGLKPYVGEVEKDSAAEIAGLTEKDLITNVADRSVTTWEDTLFALVKAAVEGDSVNVTVQDENLYSRTVNLNLSQVRPDNPDSNVIEQLGIEPFSPSLPPIIGTVVDNEPADLAGFKMGDRILRIDDEPVSDWVAWVELIRKSPEKKLQVQIDRAGQQLDLALTPWSIESGDQVIGRIGASVEVPEGFVEKYRAVSQYTLLESLQLSVQKTWDFSILTLRVLGQIITGDASINNLSGPITIAQTAGQSASFGFIYFMKFLAVVSISLGVLNLLPIPVLDGGHLFLYALEAVWGKALPESFVETGQRIGMALLLGLMMVAFYVDLNRLFS